MGYYYQPHHGITIRVFSDYLEDGDAQDVVGIPDYAYFSTTKNLFVWRDLYPYGYIDSSFNGVNGGMTRYAKVAARLLHKIPESISFEYAAMTEPCAVAYSATIAPGFIKPGDRIVVLGPGPIGVLCAAMAKLAGAEVALVGLAKDQNRLNIAKAYGCEVIIGDANEWAKNVDGLGADGVVDAAGVSASLKHALEVIRPDGWISKVGWGPQPLDFSLDPLVAKNVTLRGSFSHNWPMWERVLRLLGSGKLDLKPVLGGVFPIKDWQVAFEKMQSGEILKSVIKPE